MLYNLYFEGCIACPVRIRAFQSHRDPFPECFSPCVMSLGRAEVSSWRETVKEARRRARDRGLPMPKPSG